MSSTRIQRYIVIKTMMTLFVFFAVAMPVICHSAVPQKMNYQGYLTDSGGNPITGTKSILFSIYNVTSGGTALWSETQSAVTVQEGIYSVVLGSVTAINLPFDEQYYLGVNVESDGEMTPRLPLSSVGYAFRAVEADSVGFADDADLLDGNDSSYYTNASNLGSGTVAEAIIDAAIARDSEIITNVLANDGSGSTLDADLLDGQDSSYYTNASNLGSGTVAEAIIDATIARDSEIITNVLANDGSGSTLDADLLDGNDSADFASAAHNHNNIYFTETELSTSGGGSSVHWDNLTSVPTGLSDGDDDVDFSLPYNKSVSSSGNAFEITQTGTGRVAYFEIDNAANSNNAIYATTNGTGNAGYFNGDVEVNGKVAYATARTHYLSVPGEAFVSRYSALETYVNHGGNGGAYISSAGAGALIAQVHLPHDATITKFEVFFDDDSLNGDAVDVDLYALSYTGSAYTSSALASSTGADGYYSVEDTTIGGINPVDNTQYGYHIRAYSASWSGGGSTRIMGAVITYTLSEAP